MSKKITFWLALLFTPVLLFTGWGSKNITGFYYYKNQQFPLTLKSDMIFIKAKKDISEENLRNALSGVSEISIPANANVKDLKFFVNVNTVTDEASLVGLAERLTDKNEIEYASPVFSPDGGTTLIGVENEIMVQFRPSFTEQAVNTYIESKGLQVKQKLDLTGGLSYILTVPERQSAIDVANEVHLSGNVNWSEPNLFFTNLLCFTPNDPFFNQQWSANNTGTNIPGSIVGVSDCDMDVDSAWDISLGNNKVIVAISDTGIDTLHEDLSMNMVPGTGFNFFNNTPGGYDDGNHGTACAGIVAAKGNNSIGVSGVAPNSRLIASKWLSSTGNGNYAGAVGATVWSYQKGAWIISNSWGFVGGASSALDQAINDATTLGRNGKGSVFTVASGNENGTMRYPAISHPRVFVVGGISPCNQRKSNVSCDLENFWGSSFGANLHVVSPCVKIYTTDRTGSVGYSSNNYFSTFNGTSSATPNVSGVCALVLSADSNQTWDTVRARISRTSEKRGAYTYTNGGPIAAGTWNNEMGYGLVNAYAALKLASFNYPLNSFNLTAPAAGTLVTSFPGSSATVSFNWDTSASGANYKWIFGTSLPTRQITMPSGTNSLTMTLGQLDVILANLGVAPGGQLAGAWDVWATRNNPPANDSLKAANGPRTVTLRRGQPSLTAFNLVSPVTNTTIITSNFNNSNINFNWTRSGSGTTYRWKFGSPSLLSTTRFNIQSNGSGFDSVFTVQNAALDAMLGSIGVAPGDSLVGQWAAYAYSGSDSLKSVQTFNLTLRRQGKGDVLIGYDSSLAACRTSRDSVITALNSLGVTYDLWNRGTQDGTTSISFRGYKKVMMLGEATSVFSARVKDSLKAYLNAGGTTIGTKSKLIIFGEDVGYTFGRPASTYFDADFANNYLGFDYVADAPNATSGGQGLKGDHIWSNLRDSTAGPWPDVLKRRTGVGTHVLYRFRRHENNPDSANCVGTYRTNWNVAVMGVDVESLRPAVGGPTGSPVRRFVKGALDYVDAITTGTGVSENIIPDVYELAQNYPNPFNPSTEIKFGLPEQGFVSLKVYDITGRQIANLVNEVRNAGFYSVNFNAGSLSSGVYFYRIESGSFVQTRKMLLVK